MAETLEGSKPVDTLSVSAHLALKGKALVYVCEVEMNFCFSSKSNAQTSRRAKCVASVGVYGKSIEQKTVPTHAVVVVRELKAGEAETVVGSHCVFTGAITARLPVTLINV